MIAGLLEGLIENLHVALKLSIYVVGLAAGVFFFVYVLRYFSRPVRSHCEKTENTVFDNRSDDSGDGYVAAGARRVRFRLDNLPD